MDQPIYAFTGHRPKDLPQDFHYANVAKALDLYFLASAAREPQSFITGGALGIDTWAAEYALQHRIPLHLILPFEPEVMMRFWPDVAQRTLLAHIEHATQISIVHHGTYDVAAYQRRNEAMVDHASHVIAFWTGKPFGGTANCIRYAERVGKPVTNLLKR